MRPAWYSLDSIPFDKMWTDDKLWYPYLLTNKSFYGYVKFKNMTDILDYELKEVKSISDIDIPKTPTSLSASSTQSS